MRRRPDSPSPASKAWAVGLFPSLKSPLQKKAPSPKKSSLPKKIPPKKLPNPLALIKGRIGKNPSLLLKIYSFLPPNLKFFVKVTSFFMKL
jgi:hypothetical protein